LPRAPVAILAVCLACAAGGADAAGRVRVVAGSVERGGVRAHEVEGVLLPGGPGSRPGVSFYAARVDGLETPGTVETLHVDCPALEVTARRLACRGGRLSGRFGELGAQDTPLDAAIDADDAVSLALPGLRLGDGGLALEAQFRTGAWSARLEAADLSLEALSQLPSAREAGPVGLTLAGRLSAALRLRGLGASLSGAEGTAGMAGLVFADEAGTLAGENLAGSASFVVGRERPEEDWRFEVHFDIPAGQAYVDPVFVDFGEHAVSGELSGRLPGALDTLALEALRLEQQGVGSASGTATLALAGETWLRQARLRLEAVDVGGAIAVYAAPVLISTDFADVQGTGRVSGEVDIEDDLPSRLELDLEDVLLDSVSGALSVEGLSGRFSWFNESGRNELAQQVDSAVFKSRLGWRSLRLWGIEFGAAELPFTTTGRHFRLLDPVVLPIFDGGLAIETLRIRHAGTPRMYLRFDAELRPISVALIGRARGWPEFSGTLAGRIPKLELADGLVTLGGNIEAQVFDGTITLGEVRMRDPLGQYPQLFADIEIEALELEQITSTFEFGMITGRLSGYVRDLEMFDWMPVSFEGRLFTTPGDRTPHRISQRAVSNLSSIGGGSGGSVAAALQSGFLRFFDSFRYDRLGLSCTLANDVCRMDGIEPAPGGYYIVKGSGLPRIDVIGNQRRVAWTRLVRQLGAITQSSGPVVE